MMLTNSGKLGDLDVLALPAVVYDWLDFTAHDNRGSFTYSVVPLIYSISTLAVVTWFLTIFVLANYTVKATLIFKVSTCLSSIFLAVVMIKAIVNLHDQQTAGYFFGGTLLDALNDPIYLVVIDFIVVLLLQINQVQVVVRLFLRQNDKRLIFIMGISTSISSQIIWGISKLYNFADGSEAGDIVPAFIYLTRTAMAICYAAFISGFLLLKIKYIFSNRNIWLLTILTVIVIYTPVAFFIADVANAFIFELSEVFSVVSYLLCVVIPWEWCNAFHLIMVAKEKEGILGRRFYEDELYDLDDFELYIEETDEDENGQKTNKKRYRSINPRVKHTNRFQSTIDHITDWVFTATDSIIGYWFAIPKSSTVTLIINKTRAGSRKIGLTKIGLTRLRKPSPPPEPTRAQSPIRDVFVYSTKQVTINFTDDE